MPNTTIGGLAEAGVLEVNDGYRTKRSELGKPGVPILRVAEVLDGRISPTYGDHIREEFRPMFRRKSSMSNDVVVTTKGTVGRVARIAAGAPEFVYSPQVCYFRVHDPDVLDAGWLYQWLRGPEFRRQVQTVQDQTDMAAYINLVDLRATRINLPPLAEQRAIAHVLGALDDKIEANRRVAHLAESLAAVIATEELERSTGDLISVEQLADVTKGVSYRSEDLVPGRGWLVSLKCVGRNGSFQLDGLKPFSGPARADQEVEEGDVLVAQTDLTQKAEVIGRPIRVERRGSTGRLVASLDFAVVRPRPPLTREALYAILSQRAFREHALGFCNGTTVLHMNQRAIPTYQVTLLTIEQIRRLTAIMQPLLERAYAARLESDCIAALRDALLPKLLSGDVRVSNAKSFVGEAI